ncbi:hypothetical protein HMPREF9371_0755 [Neisseria shayeganii 871]|uniref:Uncharacterized protein n=1 Tax=Neisseria shayeganii 871 TaxID=1032488 RepID=G4CGL6_9NEIS|nr:hypothetical protein HMPREF9371_0755 [Neisseria shayeganii 871]
MASVKPVSKREANMAAPKQKNRRIAYLKTAAADKWLRWERVGKLRPLQNPQMWMQFKA